ncbi:MAG: TetR family transcriptional regulator [Candidatus Hydrogenedens sp.]|nr:TetR family transcriptional regulator [Candidatus Hydrogenedens sp.]
MTKRAEASTERILSAATALFAEHGYEGVSTRQLASATGLNLSTVHHHVGSKRELYIKVFERLFAEEEALVDELLGAIDDDALQDVETFYQLMARLIGRFLEFSAANPARQRLYVQRWLEPADELRAREAESTLRLYRRLARILQRGQELGSVRADLDIGYFLRSFDFLLFSYFTSGAFSWRTLRAEPRTAPNVKKFKAYLLDYARHMLEPR